MNVKSNIVKVNRRDETKPQRRFLCGMRTSIVEQNPLIAKSNAIDVRPIAASARIVGSFRRLLIITLYGASLVFTPWRPRATGNCVDIMVMLAAVTNAEIGTYGMNSMTHPSRSNPKKRRTAPDSILRAWAICGAEYMSPWDSLMEPTTLPTRSEPTAVV